MPPAGGLRKVLARCTAEVVEGPVVAEGSKWVPVADEMARPLRRRAGPRGAQALVRLGAVPRPARPGRGGMTTWQGVGWAKHYLDAEAARRARGADARHGSRHDRARRRLAGGRPRCTSSASATGGSTCRRSATRSSSSHLEEKVLPTLAAPALPRAADRRRGVHRRGPRHPAMSAGTRASSACAPYLEMFERLTPDSRARLDHSRRQGRPLRRADRELRPGPRLRRRDPRRQPARHRGPARDRVPGLLPRPLAAERHRPLGDDRIAAAGRDRRRHRQSRRHRVRASSTASWSSRGLTRSPCSRRPRRSSAREGRVRDEVRSGDSPWSSFERHGYI